jgi:beta-1,4-galactosyltransferase 1
MNGAREFNTTYQSSIQQHNQKQLMKKLGIVAPYRDRTTQLHQFINSIKEYIQDIPYELIIVEQADNKDFNRGKLLNIGFLKAEELGCDYVVFHDIDMLPVEVDYSYSGTPLQIATDFKLPPGVKRSTLDEYFGGVTLFPVDIFKQINGYSNKYFGWGFEDDDLLFRCRENNIDLDFKAFPARGKNVAALEFNGEDSYVRFNNKLSLNKPFSIFVSCSPHGIKCDKREVTDEYSIFSIPGHDMTLTYNSFKRYRFETWMSSTECLSLHSEHLPAFYTNFTITINPKSGQVTLYQAGTLVGRDILDQRLMSYNEQPYMYLGVGDPNRFRNKKYFWGLIDTFAIFDKELDQKEITSLSNNKIFGLTQPFKNYNSVDNLQLYYDSKFIKDSYLIDLSGNNNNGFIRNATPIGAQYSTEYHLTVPHKRKSTFEILSHKENGFKDGYWVNPNSRKNQIYFYEKLNENRSDYQKDGLTTCFYKVESESNNGHHHLLVKL